MKRDTQYVCAKFNEVDIVVLGKRKKATSYIDLETKYSRGEGSLCVLWFCLLCPCEIKKCAFPYIWYIFPFISHRHT
jgi:hypothetical protein